VRTRATRAAGTQRAEARRFKLATAGETLPRLCA